MTPEDADLESRIEAARQALIAADNAIQRRECWERMRSLILERSFERVAEMEAERGLS